MHGGMSQSAPKGNRNQPRSLRDASGPLTGLPKAEKTTARSGPAAQSPTVSFSNSREQGRRASAGFLRKSPSSISYRRQRFCCILILPVLPSKSPHPLPRERRDTRIAFKYQWHHLSSSGRGRQCLPVQQFVAQAGIEALDVSDSPMSCRARCRRSWRRLCVPKTIGRIWNCEWPVPASSSLQYAGAIYSFAASNRIMSQLSIIPYIHFSHESRSNSPMTIEQREKSVMSQTTRSCLAQS
jgi:hypothetical protein